MKKILRIIALVMVVSLMASCCSCQNKNEYAFYVSTKGGEGADGSAANPFATLEQARDAVRKIDKSAYDKIKVLIEPGDYRVGSLKFTAEDSGTKNCPVVYTANGDGEVVINGGITISPESFTKVTDEKTKNRLAEAVRDRVVCTDLKALGLTEKDWGKLYAIGSYSTADKYDGDYVGDLYCELYVNDSRMTMARYPNNGEWLYTGEVLQTGDTSEKDHVKTPGWKDLRNPKSDVYALDDALAKRIAGWAEKEDVWMFGYPGQDWADESSPIGTFDAVKKTLSPKFVSRYEPKANAPYYFYNVLEELDSEGEWYLDRKNGLLYLYTPENFENATVDLALTTDPVISCEKTDNLSFENLTIKGSRGTGISLSGNRDTVQGCTVKNVSGLGIYAEGTDCLVSDCEICQIGKGGVELQGGDEVTLEAGNNVCENCFIHDWSQIYMTYQAGVSLRGVGNICAHNEMKNSPHLAIKWSGNNHIIEYGDIDSVTEFLNDIKNSNRNLFERIVERIKEILQSIRDYFPRSEKGEIKRLETLFEKAVASVENANGEKQYSKENDVDNYTEKQYNNNRGESYERTDEFRRLQEESRRMSDEEIQLYHSGSKQIDEPLRRRLSRSVKRILLVTNDNGTGNANGILNLTAKGNNFNIFENVNPYIFHDVFEIVHNYLKFGELVDLHNVNTTDEGIGYNDCLNFLSEDGLSGFSITPDGDLISVFNASSKKGFLRAISSIVKDKAKTLDCYASPNQNLRTIYQNIFGFKTASIMDYNMEYDHDNIAKNHNSPQIAFMVNTVDDVKTKHFNKNEYDEALNYRNSFIKAGVDTSAFSNAENTQYSKQNDLEYLELAKEPEKNEARLREMVASAFMSKYRDTIPSELLNEDGTPKVLYHGTDADFTVFDMSKGRSTMDIQGAFFSPWEIDSAGYGPNVGKYYLSIKKPASESVGYKALHKFQGQNNAGVKAREYLISLGYDGVFNGVDNDIEEYIAFYPNQIKSADLVTYDDNGNIIPLSERFNSDNDDIRYSMDDDIEYDKKVEKYGAIPQGENPIFNDTPVPNQTNDNTKVRRATRTILEGGKLTDDMVDEIKLETLKGAYDYEVYSDKSALAKAQKSVEDGSAMSEWEHAYRNGKVNKDTITLGALLIKLAVDNGNTKDVLELSAEYDELMTIAGQSLQSGRMLKKLNSSYADLIYVKKYVDRINRSIEEKNQGKPKDKQIDKVTINPDSAEVLLKSKSDEGREEAKTQIMSEIASQMPTTIADKFTAWRYLAMLGNPRTHIRNIVGNAIFTPAIKTKNVIGSLIEKLIPQEQRTKSAVVNKNYKNFATEVFEKYNVASWLSNGGKYNSESEIDQYKKVFKNAILEGARKVNSDLLEKEDAFFLRSHFISSLGGFMQARGVDISKISLNDKITDADIAKIPHLAEGIAYAGNEALKATFRDASAVADALTQLSKKNKALNLVVESIIPFKKTPINILKRGIEYSPFGLIKAGVETVKYARNHESVSVSQIIDSVSAGMTGTGIFLLGMAMKSLGFIELGFGDDDKDKFAKLNGEQEYSIKFGDVSFTIDWAAPSVLPFFVGGQVASLFEDEDNSEYTTVTDAMLSIIDPILNLSMLSGLNDVFESVGYITEVTLPTSPLYRIEVADGSGHFMSYPVTETDKQVHFRVPLAVTDAGGMATMHLVISNETEVMYTYPAMLSFKGSTYGSDTRLDYTHDMSDMLQYASDLIGGYQGALLGKVDKVEGKGLSTNDYTDADKELVQTIPNKVDKEEGKQLSTNDYTNTDKELVQSIPNKANTSDVNDALANKVDKVPGKRLSTNDYTSIDRLMVQTISGKANVVTVNQQLEGKVDKVDGKGLSTNDFTNAEKTKLANLQNYDDAEVREEISNKQDKLTAGPNITIVDNVISTTGGGSGTVDQTYNAISTNAQSGTAVEQGISSIRSKANNALDMLGDVPEDTDVQSEIDRLNSIVSILRDLAKKSTYTEDVTSLVAELDSYFVDSGITQNGSILTIKSDVTATQSGTALTLN